MEPSHCGVPAEQKGTRARRAFTVYIPFHLVTTLLVVATFWNSAADRLLLTVWVAAQPTITILVVLSAVVGPDARDHWQRIGRWTAVTNQAILPWVVWDAASTRSDALVIVIVTSMATVTVALRTLATSELDREALWRIAFISGSAALALLVQGSLFGAITVIAMVVLLSIELHFGRDRFLEVLSWAESRNLVSLSDPLTGLLNRGGFLELVGASSSTLDGGAIAMIDLDRFKVINDAHGHAAGDQVLCEIARRLETALADARVGRLGGDEFGILFPPGTTIESARRSTSDALTAIEGPITTSQAAVRVRSSGGVTSIRPGVSAELLMAEADVSMYESKRRGGRRVTAFADLQNQPIESARLEQRIRLALDSGEIEFDVQPIVSTHEGYPVTTELLARWRQPDGTVISPLVFVPIIRQAGLNAELLSCALSCAAGLFERWSRVPDLAHLGININLEADTLEPGLVALVDSLIPQECHTQFGFELVESAIVDLSPASTKTLSLLGESGIRIFLDDFGTGQSSLSQLRDLPITNVKIDQSFVADIHRDNVRQEFLRLITEVSEALSISVVVEGVESPEQWAHLQALDVRAVQGFFIAEPLPIATCDQSLRAMVAGSTWRDIDLRATSEAQISRRQRRYEKLGWNVDLSVILAQESAWEARPQQHPVAPVGTNPQSVDGAPQP